MNKHKYTLSSSLLAFSSFFLIAGLSGCSDRMDIPGYDSDQSIQLRIKGLRSGNDNVDKLHVYQFDNDKLIVHTVLSDYDASSIGLSKAQTRHLYCVAGIDKELGMNTSNAAFSRMKISSEEGMESAPMFLSGYAEVAEEAKSCDLTMRRGVARIDLDARNAEMEIKEIVVEDAPAATYIFGDSNEKADDGVVTYTHTFENAPEGLEEGLFMLFESGKPVHVKVRGITRDTEVEIPAELSGVERNKVYTLRVYDRNVSLSAGFSVAEWEEGTTITGGPDTSHPLTIDEGESVIPTGVKFDSSRNLLEIPANGVSGMVLAFKSDLRVDLDTVHFIGERVVVDSVREKYVTISRQQPEVGSAGVLTRFGIDIDEQLKGRPGYEIKMELRKPNLSVSCDYVTIRVAESPYQIQTVKMAGVTWMAFNATTPDLGEQIFPLPGKTVEETYKEAWISTVGLFFQYGRQLGHNPWDRSDPAANTAEINTPWTSAASMPLPEGYHVATAKEWVALLPSGTQIPSTYTAGNGEKIKVEIIEYGVLDDSPCSPANRAGLKKRVIRFESLETGNVLIFPVCGMKGATKDLYPGNGKPLHQYAMYWYAEERGVMLFGISGSDGSFTCTPGGDKWNINGFVPTRGVKNN